MPMKKRRTRERNKEAAKGSPLMQRWLQSKPAETAAGASQTTPSPGRVMEENDSAPMETQNSSADVMQVTDAAAGPSGLQETQKSSPDEMQVEKAAAGPSGLQTTPSPGRVKEENDSTSMGQHSHNFKVKFGKAVRTIHCDQPCTVLEAIKSTKIYKTHITCADENIIIQLGETDKECMVATHFPCSCVEEDESLIISSEKEVVGKQFTKPIEIMYRKERYVLFKIDTVGGQFTKTKKIFRNDSVKKFKYLCVYAEKGITVEEALKRDGRFIDDLVDFKLSDNDNPTLITECTQKVDNLHQKSFKVCLPRLESETPEKSLRRSPRKYPPSNSQSRCEPTPVSVVVRQRGISVKTALGKRASSFNNTEVLEKLRKQFPKLKKWMEGRFPGDSYQEALNCRKENFRKTQQSFSEVHRIRKMLKLGESVCKLSVGNCVGTGFVLFDRIILTNAHLFKDYVEGGKLQEGVEVEALFGYEDPVLVRNLSCFTVKKEFVDFDDKLDYAILELNPEGRTPNQQTTKDVPQGLLKDFRPLPQKGEACIVGHPAGGVKKIDPICIIEKEERRQNVEDTLFTLLSVRQFISDQSIDSIMMGGSKDDVVTYHTSMYHGASGSPVFDALGRVFGLHSAGYTYGFLKEEHLIEFARPVLAIFKRFVNNLRESGNISLLERVKVVAGQNSNLKNILTQDSIRREEWD